MTRVWLYSGMGGVRRQLVLLFSRLRFAGAFVAAPHAFGEQISSAYHEEKCASGGIAVAVRLQSYGAARRGHDNAGGAARW